MITLTQAEKLVRRIAEVTGQPGSDPQMAKLAQDYSELCRGANRRLEQCSVMIEGGQFLQALQLAETPPPLLDLITVLSFRQAAEWRAYCQGHQLPWTEPFYDKYVRLLSSTYSRGIAGDHPFYRDYRRAVMNNDDERAISILRVIARLNPSDENTKEELKRLEDKLLRVKLETLRQILAKGDSAAAQDQLAEIETSGLPIPSAHPVWQQAQAARCQQLLRQAEAFRQEDAWQDAEVLVEEVQTLVTQHKVRLSAADTECWASLESWTKAERAAFADDQDFYRAVAALEQEVKAAESKQAANARPGLGEATAVLNSLRARRGEAERFSRPLDESLTQRCQQCVDWLQQRIQGAKRRKLAATLAVMLLAAAAVGAALFSARTWWLQGRLISHIEVLQSLRNVSELEGVVSNIPPAWMTNPKVNECRARAEGFLRRERERNWTFDTNFEQLRKIDLQQKLKGSNVFTIPAEIGSLRKACEEALANLAPDSQSESSRALSVWDAKWQEVRNAKLATELRDAELTAKWLKGSNGYVAVQEALQSLQQDKARMEPWMTEPPPLDPEIQARFLDVTNQIADWKGKSATWDEALANLLEAQTLEDYLSRLDEMVRSPFANPAQRAGAAEIDGLKIDMAAFLGELLLPKNPEQWSSLTNLDPTLDPWRTTFWPEKPKDEDIASYRILRDDPRMQNVFSYQLVANPRSNNPCKTHFIYVQTNLAPDKYGHLSGIVYDPTDTNNDPDVLSWVPKSYTSWEYSSANRLVRMQESDTFDHLDLGRLIDPDTGNFQRPVLRLLDQLNQADTSPVFRAIVSLELLKLAERRPAEWGLIWCPGAATHHQQIEALGAEGLKSGDWMLPSKTNRFDKPLRQFFEKECAVPLEKQAGFLQELTRKTCEVNFAFAGYVDVEGHPVLRKISLPAPDYWGWGARAKTVVMLFRKTGGGNAVEKTDEAPMPFTPLFVFQGDRTALVTDAATKAGYPPGQMNGILPPFFRQSQ